MKERINPDNIEVKWGIAQTHNGQTYTTWYVVLNGRTVARLPTEEDAWKYVHNRFEVSRHDN